MKYNSVEEMPEDIAKAYMALSEDEKLSLMRMDINSFRTVILIEDDCKLIKDMNFDQR